MRGPGAIHQQIGMVHNLASPGRMSIESTQRVRSSLGLKMKFQ